MRYNSIAYNPQESEGGIQLEIIYSITSDEGAEGMVEKKAEETTETRKAPQPSQMALSPFLAATQMVDVKVNIVLRP